MAAEELSLKKVIEESFSWPQVQISEDRQAGGGKRKEPSLRCPRCESNNTKFCYYNNYSRAQPRYLCRACRRYWTEGGTLRNVPVGGRKSKRSKQSIPATLSSLAPLSVEPMGVVFPNLHHHEILGHGQPPLASAILDSFPLQSLSPPLVPDVAVAVASSWNLPFATSPPSSSSWSAGGHEALGRISSASSWVEQIHAPLLPSGLWDILDGADEFTAGDLRRSIALT